MRGRILAIAAVAGLAAGCGAPRDAEMTETIRVATFNAYLNRDAAGELIRDLSTPDNAQARAVAEIIQRVAPDIVLIQEIDFDPEGRALALFQANYLGVSQNGAPPAEYAHAFIAPVNTGVASGHDLDRSGAAESDPAAPGYAGDAFGYGRFPGQYGMAILSRHPIDAAKARTFQRFLWTDMPGARLPSDPDTEHEGDWYSAEALAAFRLSSKSHWDVPVKVGGTSIHILAAHPTPPVFDGEENRNGLRNYDEIRFLADYIAPDRSGYIYDDDGRRGGLDARARFVILGDMNADPHDGDSVPGAAQLLIDHPRVLKFPAPASRGGEAAAAAQGGVNAAHRSPHAEDTSDFADAEGRGPGNLRLDYVLPSAHGLKAVGSGVFWPAPDELHYDLVGPGWPVVSSDHRLVWVDLRIVE
jgi:endonuclease/exonuclease/phosphatase family metal-dependent hydrolase